MSGPVYDSFVVIGDRRSLPQADTGHHTGGLRHRSNDSSVSMSPPANGDAVLDLSDSKLRFRYGTPGCVATPASGIPVFDQVPSSTSPYNKKNEEFINIDSGFEGNYSPRSKAKRNSASDLFDSVLRTPVTKLSSKLKKRPSFVDDEKSWNPETVQILGWVIFSLVLVCLVVMFLITYATFKGPIRSHFQTEEAKTQSESHPPPPQELPEFTGLQQEFLLDKDVTYEEVIEMKRVMEEDGNVDEEVFVEEDIFYNDLPVPIERLSEKTKQFVDPSEAALKAKTAEESQQIIEKAELILDRETQLLQEVSKKLDEFVSYTKTLKTNEIDVDEKKDEEGLMSVGSQKIDENESAIKSKPRGKRTKNKNPLTKSMGPKMSKAKIQKLSTSTTSIQPTLQPPKDFKSEGETDNSITNQEYSDEQEGEEAEDYDYSDEDQAERGEERVKRSRSGSRFGRSRVRMMTFRKRSGFDKSRDSNDIMMDDSNGDN